jgi:hypothetical protein
MSSPRVQLRFGILAEGRRFPAWAADCIERLQASEHARLEAVLEISTERPAPRPPGHLLARLYRERWLERRSLALRRVDLSQQLAGVPSVDLSNAASLALSERVRDAIAELQLDFVLCLDAITVPEELLTLPRFGVWSFCQERRAAPCFREVVEGQIKTRMALEKLGTGGSACLFEGYFATCRASWVNNIDRARFGAADFCVRVCAEIAHRGGARIIALPVLTAAEDPSPSNRDILLLLAMSGAHALRKLWELLFHIEVWNVGFSAENVEQILQRACVDAPSVIWCKPHKPGHFIADPFAYVHQGQVRVLVEDYDQVKGKISSIDPAGGGAALALASDFDLPFHLSYPCIFEEEGETYCVPEAYQSKCASLYRRTEQGWSFVRHLIEGLPVVDPTLFKHEGRYWLLFTLQNDGAWGNQKLYAYHAPSLSGPWLPHALNPVKCDIGASRPAGNVFSVDGCLFRPSQDCSTTYGAAVVISQVLTLSPTEFEERQVARIDPIVSGPYPDGLHTLNAMGDRAVFDSKKFVFDWLAWRKNWGRMHEVLR